MRSEAKQVPDDSQKYILLKLLSDRADLSQRDLSKQSGISLAKVNYCLRALIDKGCIKAVNFKNSKQKSAYLYKLTPSGLEEKARVTARFLKRKLAEYDRLEREIEELRAECDELSGNSYPLSGNSYPLSVNSYQDAGQ